MSEDKTAETLHLPSFEEKVLRRLDAIDARIGSLEKKVSERDYETKPIWERVLKEFSEMSASVNAHLTNFDRKLDIVNKEMLQLKADQKGAEGRLNKLESVYTEVNIAQDRQF